MAKRIPITGGPTNTLSLEAATVGFEILYKNWAHRYGFDAGVNTRKRTAEEFAERMARKRSKANPAHTPSSIP